MIQFILIFLISISFVKDVNGVSFKEYLKNKEGIKNIKSGQGTKAIDVYSEVVSSQNVVGELNNNFGHAFYLEQDLDSAEKYFKKALKYLDAEKKGKVLYNLGNISNEKQDLEKAIEYYIKSLQENPKNNKTKRNLERTLKKLKNQKANQKQNNNNNKSNKKDEEDDEKNPNKNDDNQDVEDKNKENANDSLKKDNVDKNLNQQEMQAQQVLNTLERKEQEARKKYKNNIKGKKDIEYDW